MTQSALEQFLEANEFTPQDGTNSPRSINPIWKRTVGENNITVHVVSFEPGAAKECQELITEALDIKDPTNKMLGSLQGNHVVVEAALTLAEV